MSDLEGAVAGAIDLAKKRGAEEISADDLLLGCLWARSQFGVFNLDIWSIDLETFGVDWIKRAGRESAKVAYSDEAVVIFDRAARIAKADSSPMRIDHLLAAFASQETGLMGDLKRIHGITSGTWRAAIGRIQPAAAVASTHASDTSRREYLTPEEASVALGVHVQTLRAYVRSGKLPALRLAGERAIRIRRADLEKAFEPVLPDSET
jgi:excisionase family DNA binding protein